MRKSISLLSIIILASACISSPIQTTTTSASTTTPSASGGEGYLGRAALGGISLKQFSPQMEAEAKKNFADACLISVVGNILSIKEKGKAGVWIFKYISKSESKAIGVKPEMRPVLGIDYVEIYLISNSLKLFKDEPFKECLDLSKIVDSTEAGKAVAISLDANGGIYLENNAETGKDEYTFINIQNSVSARVDARTGSLVG